MIREWIAIGLGGLIGTLARHAISTSLRNWWPGGFPLGTLVVNVLGCLVIGWLYRWTMDRDLAGSWWELALRVGLLGGLTTFSALGLEVAVAWSNRPVLAASILGTHALLGILAVLVGMQIALGFPPR